MFRDTLIEMHPLAVAKIEHVTLCSLISRIQKMCNPSWLPKGVYVIDLEGRTILDPCICLKHSLVKIICFNT
ncbi:hypothetical protein DVA76_18850, partial [Acinetobacter baumannii]